MKRFSAALVLMIALTSCSSETPSPMAKNDATMPKIPLDVKIITLADRSGAQPANSPYNSNHFSPTITEAIKQWATDRLQATGQSGQAIVVIKNASLVAQPLPLKNGMDTWFTRQQGYKYIGTAEVSIEASGRDGFAVTDASATRSVTLPEDPSPLEKQDAYYQMLNGLMANLGESLESGIHEHMASFISASTGYGVTAVPVSETTNSAGHLIPDQAVPALIPSDVTPAPIDVK